MDVSTAPKDPAAVVLLVRGWTAGPMVLALTRGARIHDLHLPGGKWEPCDGWIAGARDDEGQRVPRLRVTATRELEEETGIRLPAHALTLLCRYTAHTGRPIEAYRATAPGVLPDRLEPTAAGWPGWVPPAALVQPWCTFRAECARVLAAAGLG